MRFRWRKYIPYWGTGYLAKLWNRFQSLIDTYFFGV